MAFDALRYHAWHGRLRSPWLACGSIVRTTLLQVIRRKAYWIFLAIGLGQFLIYASIIYALTQMQLPQRTQEGMLQRFHFSTSPEDPQDSGYLQFVEDQGLAVMILLAFCGSLVVGSDFSGGTLPFYLSRRIDRRQYVVGKLLAIVAIVWLLTVIPAFILFIEFGLFTSSFDYWLENWQIVPSILGYGLVMGTTLAIWLATLSAYLQKAAPIAITWSSLFVLLNRLGFSLRDATDDRRWMLIDPWRDVRLTGRLFFGVFRNDADRDLSLYAATILVAVSTIALLLFVRRVRAVEVVS